MVVVHAGSAVVVAVVGVEGRHGHAVGLGGAVHGKSVEAVGNGAGGQGLAVEAERGGVVVVVVGHAAVPAEVVELAVEKGIDAGVGVGIEDGHAVHGHGHGTPAEMAGVHGHGRGRHHWVEGNGPGVRAHVALRNGHLLLPAGNARHHGVRGGDAFRLHVEVRGVPIGAHLGFEGREGGI